MSANAERDPLLSSGGLNGESANRPIFQVESNKAEPFALKKEISLLRAIGLLVGAIVGSGIFISPTGVLKETQSVDLALLVWLACGIFAILGGLCFIELGTSIQKSGAMYAYLLEAFGPVPGFLFSWTVVIITIPASLSIGAITFAEYVAKPLFWECDPPNSMTKVLACVCLVLIAAVNSWSVKWATRIINVFTYAKLMCIFILIVVGVVHLGRGNTENLKDGFKGSNTNLASIATAFYAGNWAYDGWEHLNFVTEEMKRPEKDMPRAIVGGLLLVIAVYMLVNISYMAVLGVAGILESQAVALVCN